METNQASGRFSYDDYRPFQWARAARGVLRERRELLGDGLSAPRHALFLSSLYTPPTTSLASHWGAPHPSWAARLPLNPSRSPRSESHTWIKITNIKDIFRRRDNTSSTSDDWWTAPPAPVPLSVSVEQIASNMGWGVSYVSAQKYTGLMYVH